jgi:ubiquinone/menaquinone biosynthesis C-methylase UbiE
LQRNDVRVSRKFSIRALYILDQLIPPILRDSKWFMYLPMRLVLKDTVKDFATFKDWIFTCTGKEFGELYARTEHVQELQGETDLNDECLQQIVRHVHGRSVLEVGCGRGFLAGRLAARGSAVTACDIGVNEATRRRCPGVLFAEASVERLPFPDRSYDTVICTHTLEHVRDLPGALRELRRVARHELIVVVPRQRPYKYGFSLHTQFFPYEWSVQAAFGFDSNNTVLTNLGGDWYYQQRLHQTESAPPGSVGAGCR